MKSRRDYVNENGISIVHRTENKKSVSVPKLCKDLFYLSEETGNLYLFNDYGSYGSNTQAAHYHVLDLPLDEYPYFRITEQDITLEEEILLESICSKK